MANKQKISRPQLKGFGASHLLGRGTMLSALRQGNYDDGELGLAQSVVESGKMLLKSVDKTEDESMKLRVVSTLKGYEEQLNQAQTPEEFDSMVKTAQMALKASFDDEEGKKFWKEYGSGLTDANQKDMNRLKAEKMPEFGKNSLKKMLADSQNMLAQVGQVNGGEILSRGVDEISKSPFLSAAEKEMYRDDFVSQGILNLSLQNGEAAEKLRQEYMPDNADFGTRLAKTRELAARSLQEAEAKQSREKALYELQQKTALWQAKERGEVDAAAYYVLTGEDEDIDVTDTNRAALPTAYRLIKKINSGEELSPAETENCTKDLAAAVRQKEVDFALAAEMQNQVLNKTALNDKTGLFARRMIDSYADKVLMPDLDVTEDSPAGEIFMREKAKLSFELYDAYDAEEMALREEYAAQGRKMTPASERKIAREALEKVKEAYGFAAQDGDVFFDDLAEAVKENYHGENEEALWRQFYADAPYVADKKTYLTTLAQTMEKKEEKQGKTGELFGDGKQYAANEYAGVMSDATTEEKEMKEEKNNRLMYDEERFIKEVFKKDVEEQEGIFCYPYIDTADKITVGPGVNINNGAAEIEWWYQNPINGKMRRLEQKNEADKKLINDELAKLEKYKHHNTKAAVFFADKTNLRITPKYAEKLYEHRAKQAINDIREIIADHNKHNQKQIEDFETMPEPLQIVLVDMVYNLGKERFNWKIENKKDKKYGYPLFWAALREHNLEEMITESKRFVSGKTLTKRNAAMKKLLRQINVF